MKLTRLASAASLVAALSASGLALADTSGPTVKLSGYGTVAAAVVDHDTLELRRNVNLSKGVTDKIDIGHDSKFGVQANVDFQRGLSAAGQLVAKRRIDSGVVGDDKNFDIQVEWLYGQYEFLPGVNVRLGRMALPTFLLSDSLNVGYAAPWLRAPIHLYGSQSTEIFDGAQFNWRQAAGPVNLTTQVSYGKSTTHVYLADLTPPLSEIDADRTWGVNVVAEYGDWLARVGTARVNAPNSVAGATVKIKDAYHSVGLQYDNGTALVMGELALRRQNDITVLPFIDHKALVKGKYGYVAAGWRFGALLPLLMVSRIESELPAAGTSSSANAFGASLRYDIAPNIALKAQIDRFKASDPLVFTQPRVGDSSKVNAYTVGLDFVF